MSIAQQIKALTFDTGGTILDWHSGIANVLSATGRAHGLERDWPAIANDYRRRSLMNMVNTGADEPAQVNIDDVHRSELEAVISEFELEKFTSDDRQKIWHTWHELDCWSDFPDAQAHLRRKFIAASFTILSVSLIIDTAKRNGLTWDAVISCEMIGKYKILPEAYLTAAKWLALKPCEILMVACHNFDLDAAKAVGFKTAFVARPDEWGAAGPPDPTPNPAHDIIAKDFPDLVRQLGAAE